MKLPTLLAALKVGQALPNPRTWKLGGVLTLVILLGLQVARLFGFLENVPDETVIEMVGLVFALYTKVATTDKIGV